MDTVPMSAKGDNAMFIVVTHLLSSVFMISPVQQCIINSLI